ncbi:MAG: hypothetical protein WED05_05570 [Candidatus Atabeyarchaeum deiterrae]
MSLSPYPGYVSVGASVAIGFWFVAVAYEFLLFGYFALLKALRFMAGGAREKKNTMFYLFFSLFFLFLAISRGFFIAWDFYVNQIDLTYLWLWRLGETFQWIALTFIILALTLRVFENKVLKFILPVIPAICGIFFTFLPDEMLISVGTPVRLTFDVIYAIFAVVIPLIYLYVAVQSAGVIRNSSLLLAGGFLVYYFGQVLQWIFSTGESVAMLILPPGIVILGLLIMTSGAILIK